MNNCATCDKPVNDCQCTRPAEEKTDPVDIKGLVGTTISDRYEIIQSLGSSTMGQTYKAKNTATDRPFVVKLLNADCSEDDVLKKRFQKMAKTAAGLHHPNIGSIVDYGITNSSKPFVVWAYIDGSSLGEILRKEGRLPVNQCLEITLPVCDALAYLHDQGLVHMDLKPDNIMITNNQKGPPQVRLVDFGLSGLMMDGREDINGCSGSPEYMSPEQCGANNVIDERSDIYSLGCIVYESLTGKVPHRGDTEDETRRLHLDQSPLPIGRMDAKLKLPGRLEKVIFQCLQKNPDDRYQSAYDLRGEFKAIKDGPILRIVTIASVNPTLTLAVLLVACCAIFLVGMSFGIVVSVFLSVIGVFNVGDCLHTTLPYLD